MKRIIFPLSPNMEGSAVSDLQEALIELAARNVFQADEELVQAVERERASQIFRRGTRSLLIRFQRSRDLEADGQVGRATAASLNSLLEELGLLPEDRPEGSGNTDNTQRPDEGQDPSVSGRVAQADGTGMSGLTVRAFDKLLAKESLLGEAVTSRDGGYELTYSSSELINPRLGRANLVVRATSSSGDLVVSSPLIVNAHPQEVVNLVAGEETYRGPDLYRQLDEALQEFLVDVDLETIEPRDLYSLANATSMDPRAIHDYVKARSWSQQWDALTADVYFAWFQGGLPARWGALLDRDAEELRELVEKAVERNLVSSSTLDGLADLEAQLHQWRSDFVVDREDRPVSRASLGQLLQVGPLDRTQQRSLIENWQTFSGDAEDFWSEQRQQLGDELSDELELTLQLGALTRNHTGLVSALRQGGTVRSLADTAKLQTQDWLDLLENTELDLPDDVRGDDEDEKRLAYAEALRRSTEQLLPTRTLKESFTADATIDSQTFDLFFDRNTDFEFKAQTVRSYLADHPDALADFADPDEAQHQLEALQRIFHLSPSENRASTAKVLWQNQLHSAWAIGLRGEEDFVALFDDEEDALRIYKHAQSSLQISHTAWMQYLDQKHSLGYVLPRERAQIDGIPDLESLFGEQGYCQCRHCSSFFSPSAYLVDLFLFLQQARLAPQHATPPIDTVLERLFERRPDLANIQLTCDNAKTPLPYIDLVNEILENAVVPHGYVTKSTVLAGKSLTLPAAPAGNPTPQTEQEADILRAFPQHTNPAAYDILQNGEGSEELVYPWNLPFNLWSTELGAFLEHLGAPRWRLMESVLGQGSDGDPAAERLGLTPADLAIALDDDTSVSALTAFWGLAGSSLAPLDQAETFLDRDGLTFAQLQDWLQCRFVQQPSSSPEITVRFQPESSCKIADARLDNLTPERLSRLHRFGRLLLRVEESAEELDRTLAAFGGNLSAGFFEDWANLKQVEALLPRSVDRAELLTWWRDIDTYDGYEKPSVYESLFLDPSLGQTASAEFALNADRTELQQADTGPATQLDFDTPTFAPDLQAHLLAALRWSMPELRAVVEATWGDSTLTLNLANLSYLVRVATFCRSLCLKVSEFLSLGALLGVLPLARPDDAPGTVRPGHTRRFVESVLWLRRAEIDGEELDYWLRHRSRPNAPHSLASETVGQALLEVGTRLSASLQEARPEELSDRDVVALKLARVLEPESIATALTVLDGDPESTMTEAEQTAFITDELVFFRDSADAVSRLVGGGLTDPVARYAYALENLEGYLLQGLVGRTLAEALDLETQHAFDLLTQHLSHPSNPSQPAVSVFFDPAFLTSAADGSMSAEAHPEPAEVLLRLHKIGGLAERLELDSEALAFLLERGAQSGLPDLLNLPMQASDQALDAAAFEPWRNLLRLTVARREQLSELDSPFSFLGQAWQGSLGRDDLLSAIAQATGSSVGDLDYLTGPSGWALSYPEGFRDAGWLADTFELLPLIKRVGASAEQLAQWTVGTPTESHALGARQAAKAKYGQESWLDTTAPIRNRIRGLQRDALLSFVLHHRRKHDQQPFEDVDDLYAYFLVDPQMGACANTSRTVLASSSVQLFVQRILLNLEPGMSLNKSLAEEWKWRKQYRVWEANRKVLLWPENWIEPELRDDKSPFFQELENDLFQDQLNEQTVERAYAGYLHKLHEVARLQIAAVHVHGNVLHVFGRSAGHPSSFFYRRRESARHWSAWERVELDIHNLEGDEAPADGVLLLPIVHNRRLFLFWPVFTAKRDEPDDHAKDLIKIHELAIDLLDEDINNLQEQGGNGGLIAQKKSAIRDIEEEIQKLEAGLPYYTVRMAYSEYRQGNWTAKRISEKSIRTPYFRDKFKNGDRVARYFILPEEGDAGDLLLHCHFSSGTTDYRLDSRFEYDACRGRVDAIHGSSYQKMDQDLPDFMRFMKAEDDASGTAVPLRVRNRSDEVDLLLDKAAKGHFLSSSLDLGTRRHIQPFFYEDRERTFLIEPPIPLRIAQIHPSAVASQAMTGITSVSQFTAMAPSLIPPSPPRAQLSPVSVINDTSTQNHYYQPADQSAVVFRQPTASGSRSVAVADSTVGPAASALTYELPKSAAKTALGVQAKNIRWRAGGDYVFRTFYHPYACLFLEQLDRYGIPGLLSPGTRTSEARTLDRQLTPDHLSELDFADRYAPNFNEVDGRRLPREDLTFNYRDPYSGYNWEVFFHIPLLIADRLHQEQRFEAAQSWLHYIFNPTETEGNAPYRFWKIKPFFTYTKAQMERDLKDLLSGKEKDQLQAWEEDPFNPHLLARFRPLAYMKATLMRYLDNLIAWADQLFRRDSIESINEATQLYVLAGQILGKLPTETEAKSKDDLTFEQLASSLNHLGNGWIELESMQQSDGGGTDGYSKSRAPVVIPYFCFPPNEKLLGYWDTVADRLFKIRHCMNIEGVVRQLPLFQPPIDPALLVRAAAAGVDLSSALNDLYAPLPKYRFRVLVQKAQDICQEVKSLGAALLSALEKKDAEALARLRANQETSLLKANRALKKLKIQELEFQLAATKEQKQLSQIRFDNYDQRSFMNLAEGLAFGMARAAAVTHAVSIGVAAAGSMAHQAPDVEVGAIAGPMGGATNSNRLTGGDKVGKGITAASKWLEMASAILRDMAEWSETLGRYERRQEDWDLQADLAKQEMRWLDQQILAADVQIAMAEKEKDNLELQIAQSEAVADHYERKYTREELYGWMVGQIAAVYFQSYQLAYDAAKQAEKAFRYELGLSSSDYIRFGYWDNLRKGLLSGEKLSLDLRRLEMAYLDGNQREFELTKHVSLRQLDPVALLQLKTQGSCTVQVPEWLFDMDTPGHYHRRLKSVGVSIPAVTGPYVGLHCTLTLTQSSIRRSPELGEGAYERSTESDDPRFADMQGAVQSIVTSHGQNDSGLFETQLQDERYLPFEGHGAVSSWKLELPSEVRTFDYDTITDVLIHLRYTARQGGGLLRQGAETHLRSLIQDAASSELTQMLSLKHDFPAEWHRFVAGDDDFQAVLRKHHFPYFMQSEAITLVEGRLFSAQNETLDQETLAAATIGPWTTGLQNDGEAAIVLAPSTALPRDPEARVFLVLRYTT